MLRRRQAEREARGSAARCRRSHATGNASALTKNPQWLGHVLNHLGLALAYHRLGKADDAQKWWAKAKHWMDEEPHQPAKEWGTSFPLHPHDWLALLLLRREAEQCFGAAKPNDQPATPASGPRH